jgi:chaperonin GroES
MAKSSKKKSTKKAKAKAKKPKIRPLGEKVLIKRLDPEEVTSGGIILPDSAKEKPQKGTVLAVGDGRALDDGSRADFQVKVGDKVLFSSFAGTDIKVEGDELVLMDESDILAILK